MAQVLQHSFNFDNGILTVRGIVRVVELAEKQAVFKLQDNTLAIRGSGLNVTKLDKEQGVVVMEVKSLSSLVYRQNGLSFKGLFK